MDAISSTVWKGVVSPSSSWHLGLGCVMGSVEVAGLTPTSMQHWRLLDAWKRTGGEGNPQLHASNRPCCTLMTTPFIRAGAPCAGKANIDSCRVS